MTPIFKEIVMLLKKIPSVSLAFWTIFNVMIENENTMRFSPV